MFLCVCVFLLQSIWNSTKKKPLDVKSCCCNIPFLLPSWVWVNPLCHYGPWGPELFPRELVVWCPISHFSVRLPAKFYFLVMVILLVFSGQFHFFFFFLLLPLATVVSNSFTLCIICQAAIYFAMQRKIVPCRAVCKNLIGRRRWWSDGLFILVKNLQFHLLVIRHILYMVTAFAQWWHSPHCLYNVQNYLSLAVCGQIQFHDSSQRTHRSHLLYVLAAWPSWLPWCCESVS